MSTAAKLTLAGTFSMAAGTVVFVHYIQQSEKASDIGRAILSMCLTLHEEPLF